jgi:phage gp46-like protein
MATLPYIPQPRPNGSPCPDIRLVQNLQFPKYSVTLDWQLLDDGTLDDTQALATALCVALGTNALASTDDELPDPDSTDLQGWWGDYDAQAVWNAWPIGSKLWLMKRSAIESPNAMRGATVARIKNYIIMAVQPFIDNRIASTFTVDVSRSTTNLNRIDSWIRVYRGPTPMIELRYAILWDEQQQATSG